MTDAPQFHQYPMVMVHPSYQPAVLGTSPDDRKGTPGQIGRAARFPPVTVTDEAMEQYHLAQGYVAAGKSNPVAFVTALSMPPTPYRMVEYPKMVGDRIVNDESEELEQMQRLEQMAAEAEAARIKAEEAARHVPEVTEDVQGQITELRGIVENLVKVVTAPPSPVVPLTVKGMKAALMQKAEALGVKADGRWSLERLMEEIEQAEAGQS